jgi:hypothetical protein
MYPAAGRNGMAARVDEAVRWVALSQLYIGDRQALIFLLLFRAMSIEPALAGPKRKILKHRYLQIKENY